jgi:hypothetical protein
MPPEVTPISSAQVMLIIGISGPEAPYRSHCPPSAEMRLVDEDV